MMEVAPRNGQRVTTHPIALSTAPFTAIAFTALIILTAAILLATAPSRALAAVDAQIAWTAVSAKGDVAFREGGDLSSGKIVDKTVSLARGGRKR